VILDDGASDEIENRNGEVADPATVRPRLAEAAAENVDDIRRALLDAATGATKDHRVTFECQPQPRSAPGTPTFELSISVESPNRSRIAPLAWEAESPDLGCNELQRPAAMRDELREICTRRCTHSGWFPGPSLKKALQIA
jgi:hypothetical protein